MTSKEIFEEIEQLWDTFKDNHDLAFQKNKLKPQELEPARLSMK
jgi:hypothetical protein